MKNYGTKQSHRWSPEICSQCAGDHTKSKLRSHFENLHGQQIRQNSRQHPLERLSDCPWRCSARQERQRPPFDWQIQRSSGKAGPQTLGHHSGRLRAHAPAYGLWWNPQQKRMRYRIRKRQRHHRPLCPAVPWGGVCVSHSLEHSQHILIVRRLPLVNAYAKNVMAEMAIS